MTSIDAHVARRLRSLTAIVGIGMIAQIWILMNIGLHGLDQAPVSALLG